MDKVDGRFQEWLEGQVRRYETVDPDLRSLKEEVRKLHAVEAWDEAAAANFGDAVWRLIDHINEKRKRAS